MSPVIGATNEVAPPFEATPENMKDQEGEETSLTGLDSLLKVSEAI